MHVLTFYFIYIIIYYVGGGRYIKIEIGIGIS